MAKQQRLPTRAKAQARLQRKTKVTGKPFAYGVMQKKSYCSCMAT